MFLRTNDRLINLKNVSNINILKDARTSKFRIIFNMNYNIEISTSYNGKLISDYVYWDAINEEDMVRNLIHLNENEYFKENYIDQIDGNGYINRNEISSVKFSEKKLRIIFNLSHPVTFTDYNNVDKITSEFVYVNCPNVEKYNEYQNYVIEKLGEKDGN